jgi:lactate dehydrogenase-like 2-hydroxyacid dehydrogenase
LIPRARIVVTRRLPEPALALLRGAGQTWVSAHERPLTRDELLAAVPDAEAIVCLLHDRIDEAVLAAAGSQLAVVANVAVGYDNVDVAACARRGIAVTNTPGVLTEATADLAFALILMATRRLGEGERLIRAGTTWSWGMSFMLGRGVQGKTLGIVGLGQIGRAVARRGRAFGMSILYTAPRRAEQAVEADVDATHVSFDELLATADVVSLHCPLTPSTRHLLDAAALARMKPDAFLINTTRGPVVDEAALVDALAADAIAGAGLDVYEREPDVHSALLELENVVLLPHLGSATIETRTAMALLAAQNAAAAIRGLDLLTPVP